jgi:phosphatidylserine/phosphatidylglycerophosphate/cardiolipin synthase-like enzyme
MTLLTDNFMPYFINTLIRAERYFYMTSYVASPPLKMLGLKYASVWDSIFLAIKKKVDFRLLVDAGCESSWVIDSFRKLSGFHFPEAVNLRSLGMKKKLHAKFFICDDHLFYIGSHNFTKRGLSNSYELGITGEDSDITGRLKTFFLQMWGVANVCNKPKHTG